MHIWLYHHVAWDSEHEGFLNCCKATTVVVSQHHTVRPYNLLNPAILIVGAAATNFGKSTRKFYHRTFDHIEENDGVLDPRLTEKLIRGTGNFIFLGYCQQQGLYLAAKDSGNLPVFKKARTNHS